MDTHQPPHSSPNSIRTALAWRHACKRFDPDRSIPEEDMALLLEVAQQAPSSFGLEPWNLVVVEDADLRRHLRQLARHNAAKFDASQILIFTAKTRAALVEDGEHIRHMLRDVQGLNAVKATAVKTVWRLWAKCSFKLYETPEAMYQWAARQAYIALGMVLLATAQRGLDSCPMEGFNPDELATVLAEAGAIDADKEHPVVMLALGYRAQPEQPPRHRRPLGEVIRRV